MKRAIVAIIVVVLVFGWFWACTESFKSVPIMETNKIAAQNMFTNN